MDDTSDEIVILSGAPTVMPHTRRFLISQSGLSDVELDLIQEEIVNLGGVVIDLKQNQFNSFATHIISIEFPVTEKILGGLASGKWLLHPRYIHDCCKEKKWLTEHNYELPNYNFAAKYHRNGRIHRAGSGIYKNLRVYIKLAQKSYARAFRRVMAAGEAEIVLKEDILRTNLVITDQQHYELIAQQLPTDHHIVGIEYIKDTLIHQKPLDSTERYFLKKAARYQGTPRKSESSTPGTLAHYVSNKGSTPNKLLHRIKKEPEGGTTSFQRIKNEPDDGTKAIRSPSHQLRQSIKKIPFTPKNYRNIGTYFKTDKSSPTIKTEKSSPTRIKPQGEIIECIDLGTPTIKTEKSSLTHIKPQEGIIECIDLGTPIVSTINRKVKRRPSVIPIGGSSHSKDNIISKSSSLSLFEISGSQGSSCDTSLGSTTNSSPLFLSSMEINEEQGNRKRVCVEGNTKVLVSETASSFFGFPSPGMLQHSIDNTKKSGVSEEGEMEISYSSRPSDVHSTCLGTEMDVDISVKQSSPQKNERKPLIPIALTKSYVDPVLPHSENRSAQVVIRQKQMMGLIQTFIQKENHISHTLFSDTLNISAHNDVENSKHKYTPPREMSVKETTRYESSIDDTLKVHRQTIKEQEIIVQGIEYLYVALTPEAFPPPRLLGHLLRRLVWQENRFPIIHSRALTLLYRVLDFHPPSCTETRSLYLSTLRYAGLSEDQDAVNNSWTFIKELISSTLDMDNDHNGSSSESSGGDEMIYKSINSVRLLEFIQALLQEDIRHWDNRVESLKHLMCVRIFWGERDRSIDDLSEALKVSPQISRLLRLWVKSSQAPPHIRGVIASLVGVVLHLIWRCSGTPLLPVTPLPIHLLPLAREIQVQWKEVSVSSGLSRGLELLRLIQGLTDPWQRTVVFTILFKSVTASPNIKFTLADMLDYGKFVGQEEQKAEETPNSSSDGTSKSKRNSRSSFQVNKNLSPHRVNKINHKGETPLMRACITNNVAYQKQLLDVPGIDINKTDNNGWTALHEASIRGHDTCVKLLLDYKPKPFGESLDKDGHCDIMKIGTENGMTALHDAVASNMVETVKLLLEYGGDRLLKLMTAENRTVFDLSETNEMTQVLQSFQGKNGKLDMITLTSSTTKDIEGLRLSQLSHSSLLINREECQAFSLLLLNTYLNTTGFRYLLLEMNKNLRMNQRQRRSSQNMNSIICNTKSAENEDIRTDKIEDFSASISYQKRQSIDINCENRIHENENNGNAMTGIKRKKIKEIPAMTESSQHLDSSDVLMLPSDEEVRNMKDILKYYSKDVKTFTSRKEEFRTNSVASDYFNSLNFIIQ